MSEKQSSASQESPRGFTKAGKRKEESLLPGLGKFPGKFMAGEQVRKEQRACHEPAEARGQIENEPRTFLARGGAWVLAQAVLMGAVVALGWKFQMGCNYPGVAVAGGVLLIVGGAVGLAGAVTLGRRLTPLPRPDAEARLVQHGIYAWMRHPLYTSVMLAALGWALLWQSLPALIAALALVPFFHAKARREERWLRERFPDYTNYERRVKRFLPGIY